MVNYQLLMLVIHIIKVFVKLTVDKENKQEKFITPVTVLNFKERYTRKTVFDNAKQVTPNDKTQMCPLKIIYSKFREMVIRAIRISNTLKSVHNTEKTVIQLNLLLILNKN